MDILQGITITDLTGTGLLLYMAIKLTQFDMIAKTLLKDCPLFYNKKDTKMRCINE